MKSKGWAYRWLIWLNLVLIAFSCEDGDPDNTIGLSLLDSDTYVEMIDTLQVVTSTVQLDSTISSGDDFGYVGFVNDSISGKVFAETFFKVEWPTSSNIHDDEWVDSMVLEVNYSGFLFGDTAEVIELFVHEVAFTYELPDDGYFYSHNKISYFPDVLGSVEYDPQDSDSIIEIRMTDEFTQRVFEILEERDYTYDETTSFQDYLEGLVITTSKDEDAIIGLDFSSSSGLVLYISEPDEYSSQREISIGYSDSDEQFYHLEMDFSECPFSMLETSNEFLADESNGLCLIQPAAGIFTKVELPSLENLLMISEYGTVLSAELIIKPEIGMQSHSDFPEGLVLYEGDSDNYPVDVISGSDGYDITSYFTQDVYYNENTYYGFDVSDYIIDELSDNYVDPTRSILISIDNGEDYPTLQNLLLKGGSDPDDKPLLKIHYLTF